MPRLIRPHRPGVTGRTRPLEALPRLAALADAQCGVVSRHQLAGLGVTRHHVRRQLEAERWRAIGGRVVCLRTGAVSRAGQLWAAVLHAGEQSALGGLTGLERLGLRGWFREPVHVLVPMGVNVPPLPGLVVHHTRIPLQPDLRARDDGPACTTAARCAIDAARWDLLPRAAGALVVAVMQQRLATTEDMAACAGQFDWMRNSARILDGIVAATDGADSWAEVEMARLVQRSGLPRPLRQSVVETLDGPRRVDLVVDLPDGTVLVIEVDGPHHLDAEVRVADAAKDAAVIASGHSVLRVPAAEVRREPQRVLSQLARINHAATIRAAAERDSRNAS
jgi:hypothetical protein